MTAIRIRGYHLDGYGHVNNARYLEFLEEARWAFFERHKLLEALGGMMMVVARIDIRYRRPATEGQLVDIHTRIDSVAPRKVVLTQTITRADTGKTIAEAEVSLVPLADDGRAADLPEALSTFLRECIPL